MKGSIDSPCFWRVFKHWSRLLSRGWISAKMLSMWEKRLLEESEAGSIEKSDRGSETFCSLDRKQILLQRSSAMEAAAC